MLLLYLHIFNFQQRKPHYCSLQKYKFGDETKRFENFNPPFFRDAFPQICPSILSFWNLGFRSNFFTFWQFVIDYSLFVVCYSIFQNFIPKSNLCFLFVVLACAYLIIMRNIKIPTKMYKASAHGFARFLFYIENMIQNILLFKRFVYFLDFPGICTTSFYSLQTWTVWHKYSLNLYNFNNQ